MAQIQNTSTAREIRQALGLSPLEQPSMPSPVVNVNPKDYRITTRIAVASATTSGTQTAATTDANKVTYITGLTLGIIKDATCDIATGSISVVTTIDGVAQSITGIPVLTLTAQNNYVEIIFANPLKIDKNVTITLTGSYTAGNMSRLLHVYGYTVDQFEVN